MLDPKYINNLDNYFYNRCSSKEKKELENLMNSDNDFKKEANFFFNLFRGFKALEADKLNENINQWEQKHQNISTASTTKVFRLNVFVKYAVAAAIILACLPLGYYYYNSNMTAEDLFANNFSHDTAINYINSRSMGSSLVDPFYSDSVEKIDNKTETNELEKTAIINTLNQGISAYNNHEYSEAIKSFESYIATEADKGEIEFYLAVSYLANGQVLEAKSLFEKIAKEGNKTKKSNAEWYLVLTLLKEDKVGLAQKELTKIINQSNTHLHKEKALKLQQEINKNYIK